jgi:GntR family transcriptional regulator
LNPISKLDTLPLAERARREILGAILERRFEHKLPSEDELGVMLSVSRTTVRSALQSLEQEGIVTRRRAIGTTINRHVSVSSLALQRLVGFDWLLREQGHDVHIEASVWRGTAPADVCMRFDLGVSDDYLLTDKQYFAAGSVAFHVRDVIPLGSMRTEFVPEDPPPSMFEFSREYCTRPIDHAVVQIAAALKSRNPTKLALADGAAFTRLYETHYSMDAEVVAYSVIDVDDRFATFEVFRREMQ